THADTPQRFVDENYDMADPLNGGNLNLESARKGNLGAEFFSIWVEPTLYKGQYARRTLVLIDAVKQQVAKHPDKMMFVTSPEGIEFAHRDAQKAQKPEVDKAVQNLKDKAKAEGRQLNYEDISKVERQFADRIPRPPLSALIDQIDHIAKVAGVDHVGLGSDFDGVDGQLPGGLDSPADLPKITAALMERGYSAEDCRKILGGNLLRVFREVEQVSKELQAENRPRITDKQPFD